MCWQNIPKRGACLGVRLIYPLALHWRKRFSVSQGMSTANSFSVRGGTWCPLPHLHAGVLSGLNLCRSCALSQSVSSRVEQFSCVWKLLSPCSQPWLLQSFCLTFYIDPEPWGEGFAKDAPSPLRTEWSEVPQSLQNVCFWISLLIVMSFKRLPWRGLSNAVLSFMKIGFISFLIVCVDQLSNRARGYQTPSPSGWSPQFPVVIISVP